LSANLKKALRFASSIVAWILILTAYSQTVLAGDGEGVISAQLVHEQTGEPVIGYNPPSLRFRPVDGPGGLFIIPALFEQNAQIGQIAFDQLFGFKIGIRAQGPDPVDQLPGGRFLFNGIKNRNTR